MSASADPVQKMTRMYRWTRHVYDWSRRYYLLGRDGLLGQIADRPAGTVLEIGCGTARNLRVLHRTAPEHALFGLDASRSMLDTARTKLRRAGVADRIRLAHGLAQDLDPKAHFGVERPFDAVFFSYVLSMIPDWPAALHAGLRHLAPGGCLYVVDFWDQADLPSWMASALQHWLALFDVHPRPDLIRTLRRLDRVNGLHTTVEPVVRRYAYRATVHAPGPVPDAAIHALDEARSAESKRFGSSEIIAA
jgi:S-adenosylmethionine-diacylgycerolhomoserine-N-methlytransferase